MVIIFIGDDDLDGTDGDDDDDDDGQGTDALISSLLHYSEHLPPQVIIAAMIVIILFTFTNIIIIILLRESAVDQHGLTTISEDVNNIGNLPINVNIPISDMANVNLPINNMASMSVSNTGKKNKRSVIDQQQQQQHQHHQQHHHHHQQLPMPPAIPRTAVISETSFEPNCCRIEPAGIRLRKILFALGFHLCLWPLAFGFP